jgi:hypothetical protein
VPSTSGADAAAQDARVEIADNQPAVDAGIRAVAEATQVDDTVERMQRKLEKAELHLKDAKQALADAKAAQKNAHVELKAAQRDLTEERG